MTIGQRLGSMATSARGFLWESSGCGDEIPTITASAVCQARAKLSHKVFEWLSAMVLEWADSNLALTTLQHFRVIACDGTTLRLARSNSNYDRFGSGTGEKVSQARAVQFYDVFNELTIGQAIAHYEKGEREIMLSMVDKLPEETLLIMDRGFPSAAVFSSLRDRGIHFCARVQKNFTKDMQDFIKSGEKEGRFVIKPSKSKAMRRKCREAGASTNDIELRRFRFDRPDGKCMILVTSVLDDKQLGIEDFEGLYHHRWAIEEDYKLQKCRMSIESLMGKSPERAEQEFHASVLLKNIASILSKPVRESLEGRTNSKGQEYALNRTSVIKDLIQKWVRLMVTGEFEILLARLQNTWSKMIQPVRKGRSEERIIHQRGPLTTNYPPG